jgi:predicted metalloprotease
MFKLFGRTTRTCGSAIAIVFVVFGVVSTRPAPAGAELYTVEEVVDYMVPFLDQYWYSVFAGAGQPYYSPNAIYYYNTWDQPGSTSSGCGELATNNAFYCWTDWSIYLDYTFLDAQLWTYGDFAVAAVVAHEWGHHVEQVIGMSSAAFYSVQLELFADCLTGAAAAALDWAGALEAGDLEEAYGLALTIGDPIGTDAASAGAHGSSDQRIESFVAGYLSGDPAVCGPTVDVLLAA